MAERYPVDLDGDGTAQSPRDLALVTNSAGWLLVYDLSERPTIELVGRVELPGSAAEVTVDAARRLAYVAGPTQEIYVVSLDATPSLDPIDLDADGVDDRGPGAMKVGSRHGAGVLEPIWLSTQDGEAPILIASRADLHPQK